MPDVVEAQQGDGRKELSRRSVLQTMAAAGALAVPGRRLLSGLGSEAIAPRNADHVTLNGWTWQPKGPGYDDVMADDAKVWEKQYGGVGVNLQVVDYGDYFTKFDTAVAGGVPPDFLEMAWAAQLVQLAQAGSLKPLEGIIKHGFPPFFTSTLDTLKWFGHTWAIPMDVNSLTIGYNKKIFAKLGLKPPSTHAELLALAKPLKSYGGMALAIADGWPAGDIWFAQMAYEQPVDTLIRKAEFGKMKWTAAPFLDAAKRASELRPLFNPAAGSLTTAEATALFASQQAAMFYPIGNFLTPEIAALNPTLDYDIFPFPPPSTSLKPRATGGAAVIWAMSHKSDKLAAFADYIRVVMSPKGLALLVKNDYFPATADAVLKANTNALYRKEGFYQKTVATRSIFLPKTYAALLSGMQSLLVGSTTAQKMVAGLEAAAKSEKPL